MSIYRRGKVWWSRLMRDAVVVQQSLGTRNRQEALDIEATLRSAAVKGEFGIVDRRNAPTLADFEKRLFDHLRFHVKPRTLQFYKEQYGILKKSPLKNLRISMIDSASADAFKQWRLEQNVAVSTANHGIRTLRRALHQAEDWKLIPRAPKLKLLTGENSREAVITETELQMLIDYAAAAYPKSNFQFLLPFLVDTGLRVSEACNLKRDDLDFKMGFVRVVEGKSKAAKREVPLTDRAATAAKAAWERSRCSYIFTAYAGRKALTRHYVSQQFRVLADSLNMHDTVLHSTRHTFCTRLGESGVDAFTIQKLAGHASITISQRYVHSSREVMIKAIKLMDKANNPPAPESTEKQEQVEEI
jgi:integrase